jgi:hypothetical protein
MEPYYEETIAQNTDKFYPDFNSGGSGVVEYTSSSISPHLTVPNLHNSTNATVDPFHYEPFHPREF